MNNFDNDFNNENNSDNNNGWKKVEHMDSFTEVKEEQYTQYQPNNEDPNFKKPKKNTLLKVFVGILCVLFIVSVVGIAGSLLYQMDITDNNQTTSQESSSEETAQQPSLNIQETPSDNDNSIVTLSDGEMSSEDIAEKVSPSVVGILVYVYSAQTQEYVSYAIGSGVIMSEDGYIITNAHVVMLEDGATVVDKIEIYLDNGETEIATLVGADVKTDLAVVKIEKNNLVAAEFGDSSAIKVGERALVIGTPKSLSFRNSFSQGVISGVDREVATDNSGYTINCIQTDASINPGNSGGALINKYGQVIGINSSKIAGENFEGMGFAIPINQAKPVLESLINSGYVAGRVRIGISFTSVTEGLAEISGLPTGLRVVLVDQTVDAYQKDVRVGDIITHIDGVSVITLNDVSAILTQKKPGDTVNLTIFRSDETQSKTIEIEVVLQEDLSGRVVS